MKIQILSLYLHSIIYRDLQFKVWSTKIEYEMINVNVIQLNKC